MKIRGYYFITDAKLSRAGNISDVKNAVKAGACAVQYRNKEVTTKELLDEARKLRKICKNTLFIINDRVDITLAVCADGVHLGTDDMPYEAARKLLGRKKIIGLTVHNIEEAKEAQGLGANYISVSPIFETSTKLDAGNPCGVELIRKIKKEVTIPIIAIGGINLANASQVIKARADGLCAISTVVTKGDVKAEIEKFQELFKKTVAEVQEDFS